MVGLNRCGRCRIEGEANAVLRPCGRFCQRFRADQDRGDPLTTLPGIGGSSLALARPLRTDWGGLPPCKGSHGGGERPVEAPTSSPRC